MRAAASAALSKRDSGCFYAPLAAGPPLLSRKRNELAATPAALLAQARAPAAR